MGAGIVTGGLDTLYLGKQPAKQVTHFLIIVYHDVRLPILLYQFHNLLRRTFLVHPAGYELTVAHMGFFYIVTRLDTYKLCHQTIHQIGVVLSLISIRTWSKPQFHQLRVGHVVESEQVGARFFDSRTICLQRIRVHTREQFTGTMSQTFMQVSMQFICHICVLINQLKLCITVHKLLIEPVAMSCLIISICNVTDCNGFRTMMATYPVGIGQVDADSSCRIQVTGQNSRRDYLGRHPFHFLLLELSVYRRMVLKPLCIAAYQLCTLGSFQIFKIHQRFPACLHAERVTITFGKTVHKVNA